MQSLDNNTKAFLALVRAGLWKDSQKFRVERLGVRDSVDWGEVHRLAEEQSVVGLVAAGLEHVADLKAPQGIVLQFVGQTLQLEQRNSAMNSFVGVLVDKMRDADIYTLLVKGQGIAQCYEKPLWRACGDVDLFLSDENYQKAKSFLLPLAKSSEPEGLYKKHFEMVIDPWVVELHGSMRTGLSSRVDRVIDEVQREVFEGGDVRSWMNGTTQVFLPGVNSDVIFVFTHFIKHFYCEGLGLRQICDWCRLLYRYRSELDLRLLESRIKRMGLMTEWKAFATLAVEYLGMPTEAMPFYDVRSQKDEVRWKKKAARIMLFILDVGNFGHNRDQSYLQKYPFLIRKTISLGRRCADLLRHARIFPLDSMRFFPGIIFNGLRSAVNGE